MADARYGNYTFLTVILYASYLCTCDTYSYHNDQDMSFEVAHQIFKRGDIVGVNGFPSMYSYI